MDYPMTAAFQDDIRENEIIAPRRLAERLRFSMADLARVARLDRKAMTLYPSAPTVQIKLEEIARVITRAAELAGEEGKAVIWFKHQLLSGVGKTAAELVANGDIDIVMEDLDRMAAGVYS